jgi:2-dehydropantoate 2-reductase
MRIGIVGAGAMGTVLGAYLTKNGCAVDLVDTYADHVNALNREGAHIVGSVDFTVPVRAMTPDKMAGVYDLIFLFIKQNANSQALPNIVKFLNKDSTVCTLQNGVPEPGVASYVGERRTLGGTVLWGATFLGPGISELTHDIMKSDHLFEIGSIDGSITPRLETAASVLEIMGRPVAITKNLMGSRWEKLVNNACMSGMSAACGCVYNDILEDDNARACLSYLGYEVKQCCEASGYRLTSLMGNLSPSSLDLRDQTQFDENQRMFIEMYDGLRPAKASMLQDLEKGNVTEVNMINGYVSQTGKRFGILTPFNDAIVDIVTRIEKGDLPLSKENLNILPQNLFRFDLYHQHC